MPAKDLYHDAVKAALIKDGWLILADHIAFNTKILTYMLTWRLNDPSRLSVRGKRLWLRLRVLSGDRP
jgi:hypothetical protein